MYVILSCSKLFTFKLFIAVIYLLINGIAYKRICAYDLLDLFTPFCLDIYINPSTAKLFNWNFLPLEGVSL